MKISIAAAALAATTAVTALPTPASAIGFYVGPRGGVGVGIGGPRYGYGYARRPFYGSRVYEGRSTFVRPGLGLHRGWRRF